MKMKIDINEVRKSGLTLEQVLALLTLESERIGERLPYSSVEDSDLVNLFNKGLLNADGNGYTVTREGRALVNMVLDRPQEPEPAVKVSAQDFEDFWEAFPSNDQHGNWLRTRTLKSDKNRCQALYKRAIEDGRTKEEILRALNWEIKDRKAKSTTSNRMSFMKASSAWLYQREYEIILEEIGNSGPNEGHNGSDEAWLTTLI